MYIFLIHLLTYMFGNMIKLFKCVKLYNLKLFVIFNRRFGKKSTRLVRAAAVKLSQELFAMIERPDYALTMRIQEGNEHQIFKIRFVGWEEVIAVDFTRTAESVQKTGADLTKWAMKQETKVIITDNILYF